MIRARLYILFGLLISNYISLGQKNDQQKFNLIEQRIEMIAENAEDEDIDFTTLFDYLAYIYDHPLNINNPKNEELFLDD